MRRRRAGERGLSGFQGPMVGARTGIGARTGGTCCESGWQCRAVHRASGSKTAPEGGRRVYTAGPADGVASSTPSNFASRPARREVSDGRIYYGLRHKWIERILPQDQKVEETKDSAPRPVLEFVCLRAPSGLILRSDSRASARLALRLGSRGRLELELPGRPGCRPSSTPGFSTRGAGDNDPCRKPSHEFNIRSRAP